MIGRRQEPRVFTGCYRGCLLEAQSSACQQVQGKGQVFQGTGLCEDWGRGEGAVPARAAAMDVNEHGTRSRLSRLLRTSVPWREARG